jgi:hypothetical protein
MANGIKQSATTHVTGVAAADRSDKSRARYAALPVVHIDSSSSMEVRGWSSGRPSGTESKRSRGGGVLVNGDEPEVVLGVEEGEVDAGVDEGDGEMEHGVDESLPWPREQENVHSRIHRWRCEANGWQVYRANI